MTSEVDEALEIARRHTDEVSAALLARAGGHISPRDLAARTSVVLAEIHQAHVTAPAGQAVDVPSVIREAVAQF